MSERPELQYSVKEACPCGASLELAGSRSGLRQMFEFVNQWREDHRHRGAAPSAGSSVQTSANGTITVEAPADWRMEYLGQECAVCREVLTAPNLTTVSGKPVHIDCRRCVVCDRQRPYGMNWTPKKDG